MSAFLLSLLHTLLLNNSPVQYIHELTYSILYLISAYSYEPGLIRLLLLLLLLLLYINILLLAMLKLNTIAVLKGLRN